MANKYWSPGDTTTTTTPRTVPVAAPTPAPRISKPPQEEKQGFFEKLGSRITSSSQFQSFLGSGFGSKVMGVLGKVGEFLQTPKIQKVGDFLMSSGRYFTGGTKELERLGKGKDGPNLKGGFFSREGTWFDPDFIRGGKESVKNPQRIDPWSMGFSGKGSILAKRRERGETITGRDKDFAFLGELFYPTIAELGIGTAAKAIPGVSKLGRQILKPLSKGTSAAGDFIKKSKLGDVIEALEPGFKSPGAKKLLDQAKDAANFRVNQLHKVIKMAAEGLTPAQQRIVGELMEGSKKAIARVDEPLRAVARQMTDLGDVVGREGVELWEKTQGKFGLSPESFAKYEGKYLTHIWNKMIKTGDTAFITKEAPSLWQKFMKKRTGKEGYIKEFSPAVYKGLGTQITENEIAKGYIAIAERFGLSADEAAEILATKGDDALREFGYVPADVIDLKTAGIFKDTLLPKDVVDFIKGSAARVGTTAWDKAWSVHDKLMNAWKLGKTIYNPAYHVRNIISNQILANMATGGSLVKTVVDSFNGLLAYLGKSSQKYVSVAEDIGLIRKASLFDGMKILMEESDLIKKGNIQKWGSFWKNFQNSSEDIAKLTVFKRSIDDIVKAGSRSLNDVLADPKALKAAKDVAEEAIFSPYRIGSGERALMSRIIPFYSFSRQALPFTAKTAVKHPQRLAKYPRFKQAVEAYGGDVVPEEDRPAWQKGSIQLPFRSGSGEPIALDTSYLYPWGNIDEVGFERGQLPFGLSLNPFGMEIAQQQANKDFYFDREIAPSKLPGFSLKDMTSTKPRRVDSQKWAHAANTLLPALYRTFFGKLKPAFEDVPDYAGRDRDVWMALFDAFGLKTTVLRPDDKRMFDLIDQRQELKEIKSQMYSTAADQRLDDADKKELLEDYVKEIEKLFQ